MTDHINNAIMSKKENCMKSKMVKYSSIYKMMIDHLYLFVSGVLTIVYIYGIKMFNPNIGIDAELFLDDPERGRMHLIALGRFGLCFLQMIFKNRFSNPCSDTFLACIFLLLSGILCCCIIEKASDKKIPGIILILFLVFYLSSPVWTEQIYFSHQSSECMFAVFSAPIISMILFYGIERNKTLFFVVSVLSLMFMISVYQASLLLFIAIHSAGIMLSCESGKMKNLAKNALYSGIVTVSGAGLYFMINKIIILLAHPDESGYLENMIRFGSRLYVYRLGAFFYELFLADIPYLSTKIMKWVASVSGPEYAEKLYWNSTISCVLFLPALIIYFIIVIKQYTVLKKDNASSYIYLTAAFMIPFSVVFLAILGGNVEIRALFALAFAGSFLFFVLLEHLNNRVAFVIALCMVIIGSFFQVQRSAHMIESDQLRYDWDYTLASDIARKAEAISGSSEVFLGIYGKKEFHPAENFHPGRVIGHSIFSWDRSDERSIAFIRDIGYDNIHYTDLGSSAADILKDMPVYPEEGSMVKVDDAIIVKLN